MDGATTGAKAPADDSWRETLDIQDFETVAEAPDPFAADAACALAGASVEMARATRTTRRADAMRRTPTFDACIRVAEAPTFAGPHHDITAWGDVAMPRDPATLPRARRAPGAARP